LLAIFFISWSKRLLSKDAFVFGDSIARGVILDDQGSYRPLKDCFASLAAKELGVALVNKARFGCTIAKGREIIERTFDRFFGKSNHLNSIMYSWNSGGNDCDFRWDEISLKPMISISLQLLLRSLSSIMARS